VPRRLRFGPLMSNIDRAILAVRKRFGEQNKSLNGIKVVHYAVFKLEKATAKGFSMATRHRTRVVSRSMRRAACSRMRTD